MAFADVRPQNRPHGTLPTARTPILQLFRLSARPTTRPQLQALPRSARSFASPFAFAPFRPPGLRPPAKSPPTRPHTPRLTVKEHPPASLHPCTPACTSARPPFRTPPAILRVRLYIRNPFPTHRTACVLQCQEWLDGIIIALEAHGGRPFARLFNIQSEQLVECVKPTPADVAPVQKMVARNVVASYATDHRSAGGRV